VIEFGVASGAGIINIQKNAANEFNENARRAPENVD